MSRSEEKKKKKKRGILRLVLIGIVIGSIFLLREPIKLQLQQWGIIERKEETSSTEKLSYEALEGQVQQQNKELSEMAEKLAQIQADNLVLQTENEELKAYEKQYNEFIDQKNTWDQELAHLQPDLFIEQFEKIYPDHAQQIYTGLKKEKIVTEQQQTLINTVSAMDEEKAARALERLILTDAELVSVIFSNIKREEGASILSEMSSEVAAQIIKLIAPGQ